MALRAVREISGHGARNLHWDLVVGHWSFEVGVDSPYLNTRIETAPRERLRKLQEERFLEQVEHCYQNSPFYQRKFDEARITPRDIRSLDDIHKIPFTTKDELKESQAKNPLWGDFLAVPLEECLR